MSILSTIKKGVVNTTANVLAAPAKLKALRAKQQADSDVKVLKRARSYDNAPDEADSGKAGMSRSLAVDVKNRLTSNRK